LTHRVSHLQEKNYSRHRGPLNAHQEHALDVYLQKHLDITAKSNAHCIEERWGIRYSESGVTDLLPRLGYVYKKPKLVPGKADAQVQLEFLADDEKIKETRHKADEILFMDALHPQHKPVMGSGWIKKGKDFQICSNTGRKRLNINGALSLNTLNMVMRYDDSINAQSTIELFKQIEIECPKDPKITIVCDNARYYRSVPVRRVSREFSDRTDDPTGLRAQFKFN